MFTKIKFHTSTRQELVNLLNEVKGAVSQSGVKKGICLVYCPHTTGGLVVNSYLDPKTPKDIITEIDRLIPTRLDFFHTVDTPSDAAGHVKSSLVGIQQLFIIHEGELVLGHSQGILFAEFDGPRNRELYIKVIEG
ncbi:MAG: secondary thiamine-phosphate synthase enzyme YjbQ [Anaerolineales bacterium]|jgi:secondary thiamine-phosphate synthase enzyme|nr:secondary thiamine-phosphate synthase enzyme YjbQ [Anaerolineales bacterium]